MTRRITRQNRRVMAALKIAENLIHEEIYKDHPTGFIGLQVHGIGKGMGPYEVAWRNIRLRELK